MPGIAEINALISRANALQQSGRLAESAAQYRTLLKFFPDHPQILATLGAIALQRGELNEGLRWLGKSLQIAPNQPIALTNRAVGLYLMERTEEALSGFERALVLDPHYADAHCNRGNALKDLGRLQEAMASYERAIALKPDYAEAHNNLGAVLVDLGRLDHALAALERALALRPGYADAHNSRGAVLMRLERFHDALAAYDRAIAANPEYSQAHSNRGVVLEKLERTADAVASYQRAIAFKPDYAEAHNNLAAALQELERPEEALQAYDRAIALKPDYVEAHSNRGVVLEALKRFDEALAAHDRAIALKPDHAQAHNNRGGLLQKRLQLDEALQSYDRAIALKPGYVEAHTNRGVALQEMRRLDEAIESYEHALAIRPQHPAAQMGKSFIKILRGQFEEGWKLYEWRWKDQLKKHVRGFDQPVWTGDPSLQGRTLLIHAEQGYGDFIQCCRYAPLAAANGARIVLEVPRALMTLIATLDGGCQVIEKGAPLPDFDLHCPVMSLPMAFGTTVTTIPAQVPYLRADPDKRGWWRQRAGPKTRPRAGLAWSGAIAHKNDHNRSIRLEQFEPLLRLPLEFHSLQIELRPEDAVFLARAPIIEHCNQINDFSDTAALIEEMDLVISVDTSVVHLAGALGKPVWILLPYLPDYRWMLDRHDSPWYPTARLFRQARTGDWAGVIAEVSEQLRTWLE